MAAAKLRRWACPRCSAGVLAPSKPRRDDVRRYCLPCSKATGRLVERTCPANDRERAAKTATRTERTKSKRAAATAAKRRADAERAAKLDRRFTRVHDATGETIDLRKEVVKVWRAARKVEPNLTERVPELVASRGSGSFAYTYPNVHAIHLGRSADWETLVHEVAHFVHAEQGWSRRSDGKRAVHDRRFYMILRDIIEKLVPGFRVNFASVTSWGYNVDWKIVSQLKVYRETKAVEGVTS